MRDPFETLVGALRNARRVAVLTGAGISAESGIPTFRDAGGLWEGIRFEDVATPEAFGRNPTRVWEFYEARRRAAAAALPNAGHVALAKLEERFDDFLLATQNVDGLHRRAGSRNLVELHGTLARRRCPSCGASVEGLEPLKDLPPPCQCGGRFRPDIVWFGEMLPPAAWSAAEKAAREAQVYLVVGTSAEVYPAAGLALIAADGGAKLFEINPSSTSLSRVFEGVLREPAGVALPRLLEALG